MPKAVPIAPQSGAGGDDVARASISRSCPVMASRTRAPATRPPARSGAIASVVGEHGAGLTGRERDRPGEPVRMQRLVVVPDGAA